MALPDIKTRVIHSESKPAWNVVAVNLGDKYKIARIPYNDLAGTEKLDIRNKQEAYEHAVFISSCFNAIYEMNLEKKSTIIRPTNTNPDHYLDSLFKDW